VNQEGNLFKEILRGIERKIEPKIGGKLHGRGEMGMKKTLVDGGGGGHVHMVLFHFSIPGKKRICSSQGGEGEDFVQKRDFLELWATIPRGVISGRGGTL